jgi:flagellar protein FlgJ
MNTASQTQSIRMPAGAPNPTPRLAWPTDEALAARVREEIGDRLRAKGATPKEIDDMVAERVTKEKEKHTKLRAAHKDFEAFFVGMLLTEMKKTVKKNEMFDGGRGEEIFEKRLTDEQAKLLVSRGDGFGIARMMDQGYLRSLGATRDNTTGEWRVPTGDTEPLATPETRVNDASQYGRISDEDVRRAVARDGSPLNARTEYAAPARLSALMEGLDRVTQLQLSSQGSAATSTAAKSLDEIRDRASRANGLKAYAAK